MSDPIDPNQTGERLDTDPTAVFDMEDGGDLGISKAIGLFRSLDYGFLLPFRKILNVGLLRKRAVRWVLLFALTPIGILLAADEFGLGFKETVWLFEAYFCLFWALYFHTLMQPEAATWKRALGYALFTMIIGMPLDVAAQDLPVLRNLYESSEGDSWAGKVFGYVLGVGPLEEACKAVPLLIFGLRKGKIRGVHDGLFLGFISGLAFAVIEGVAYSFHDSVIASQADSSYAEAAFRGQVVQIIFRMMSSPVLHGAWSGIAGWFIGLAATKPKPRWPIIVVGISFAGFLHGVNDVFAGRFMHLVIAALSLMTLMAYLTHGTQTNAAPVFRP